MLSLTNVTRVGAAVEKFGRALAPGPQRSPAPSPDDGAHFVWRSPYETRGSGLDVLGVRTPREASIANGRAAEAQREAPVLGRAVGFAVAFAAGLWFTRGSRR